MVNLPAYQQFGAALAQAIAQQQQEAQQKAQILQALGFAPNMAAMGAIPYNAGIITMDGQSYVRPGGIPPQVQQMLESFLGVKNLGARNYPNLPAYRNPQENPAMIGQPQRTGIAPQPDSGLPGFLDQNYMPPEQPQAQIPENNTGDGLLLAYLLKTLGGGKPSGGLF